MEMPDCCIPSFVVENILMPLSIGSIFLVHFSVPIVIGRASSCSISHWLCNTEQALRSFQRLHRENITGKPPEPAMLSITDSFLMLLFCCNKKNLFKSLRLFKLL
jgi:hypothetical protein